MVFAFRWTRELLNGENRRDKLALFVISSHQTAVARQIEMKELLPETDTEAILIKQLGAEPVHVDEVCRSSGLPVSTVSSTLAMMELKGMVKQVGAMHYSLARETREEYRVKVE